MSTYKTRRKEVFLLLSPVAALLAFSFALLSESPPVFEGAELRKITRDEISALADPAFDTTLTVRIRHPESLRKRLFGGDIPTFDFDDPEFLDQSGKRTTIKMGQWYASDAIWCDLNLSPLPKGVQQVTLKMNVQVDGKWMVPISTVIYHQQ